MTFIVGLLLSVSTVAAQPGTTFVVDDGQDAPDENIGDGFCQTRAGTCSLRAAIQEANMTDGRVTITLPNIEISTAEDALQLENEAGIEIVAETQAFIISGDGTGGFVLAAGDNVLDGVFISGFEKIGRAHV